MNKYLSEKFKIISLFSMILVVLFHSYNIYSKLKPGDAPTVRGYNFFVQEFFSEGLARIAVPIFFIISGYLFFLKLSGTFNEFTSKIKKRFRTLVIPYLIWSVWGLTVFFILQSIPQSRSFFGNKLIINSSISELVRTILLNPIPYQLWFIRDLILIVLLTPIIYILIKYAKSAVPILFCLIWLLRINLVIVSNEAVLFFILGAYISLTDPNYLLRKHIHKYNFFWILIWLVIVLTNTILFINNPTLTPLTDFIMKAGIVAGVIAVWTNYDNFFENKDLSTLLFYKLAQFSFFLFVFHEPVLTIIKKGLFFVIGKNELNSLLIYFLAPLLTISVAICVGYCFKRFIPKFDMIVTGGR